MTYEPLQTHGLTVDRWVPPRRGLFVTYEQRDEEWMRPLGIGTIEKRPAEFYDVLDETGELVGYTSHRPKREERFLVTVLDASNGSSKLWLPGMDDPREVRYRQVAIDCRRFGTHEKLWLVWQCRMTDAIDLIRSRFIQAIGDAEGAKSFVHNAIEDVRIREYRQRYYQSWRECK